MGKMFSVPAEQGLHVSVSVHSSFAIQSRRVALTPLRVEVTLKGRPGTLSRALLLNVSEVVPPGDRDTNKGYRI